MGSGKQLVLNAFVEMCTYRHVMPSILLLGRAAFCNLEADYYSAMQVVAINHPDYGGIQMTIRTSSITLNIGSNWRNFWRKQRFTASSSPMFLVWLLTKKENTGT
jgi:hypothetical protein